MRSGDVETVLFEDDGATIAAVVVVFTSRTSIYQSNQVKILLLLLQKLFNNLFPLHITVTCLKEELRVYKSHL